MMKTPAPSFVRLVFAAAIAVANMVSAHEGFHPAQPGIQHESSSTPLQQEAEAYRKVFAELITRWPTEMQDQLITHVWREQQLSQGTASDTEQVRENRERLVQQLEALLPSIQLEWNGNSISRSESPDPLPLCRTIASPLLIVVHNRDSKDQSLRIAPKPPFVSDTQHNDVLIPKQSRRLFLTSVLAGKAASETQLTLQVTTLDGSPIGEVAIPIRLSDPAQLRGSVSDGAQTVPARLTITCSDGVCRHAGRFADKSTFTEKPVIYPPIGIWKKTPFVYADGTFQILVPPGSTKVTAERGFEHRRDVETLELAADQTQTVDLACPPLLDLHKQGWVAGDTHVHWVTNQWNVDEPLELLAMAQRAEGLRVANNLTLLQRYANQAFIKPSQAPMGPVSAFSDRRFHVQMGEEYRNEDLYGHLCFLNIDWLVQPIGTGSIIAGPDALDYPLNRAAIEACRQQSGLSIEAHGTGGNKDVPVNVIHNLTDSLDQIEPEMYYRLLDCGFQLPLTNGSDHPARTLGVARAYVRVDGEFRYEKWIEGIRRGRTFTSSGPLLFLTVNDAEIGDTLSVGESETLEIHASVVSRDPIGTLQLVSNGKVLAEKQSDQTTAELQVTIPAAESRWIVARCSNRHDGRSDFGFGNFNVITGPGVAHTSPIYAHVDDRPRLAPDAVAFWTDRIRVHLQDVLGKGRFATQTQRQEAVDYLQSGIDLFSQLEANIHSARDRGESWEQLRQRMIGIVQRFGKDPSSVDAVKQLKKATSRREVATALAPLVALEVSVNPESRVKINARRAKIELHEGRPQRFLIEVDNTAGITAPMNLSAIDVSKSPPAAAEWCTIEVVDSPFTSRSFTGAKSEYKVMQITPYQAGLREVRIVGDAGQGTQDLGFRATADVLLDVQPKRGNR